MRPLLPKLFYVLLLGPAIALGEIDWTAVNRALVDSHVIPRYQSLAEAADVLFRIGENRRRFVAVSGPVGARWDNHLTTAMAPSISNKVSRGHENPSLSWKERTCLRRAACSLEPTG